MVATGVVSVSWRCWRCMWYQHLQETESSPVQRVKPPWRTENLHQWIAECWIHDQSLQLSNSPKLACMKISKGWPTAIRYHEEGNIKSCTNAKSVRKDPQIQRFYHILKVGFGRRLIFFFFFQSHSWYIGCWCFWIVVWPKSWESDSEINYLTSWTFRTNKAKNQWSYVHWYGIMSHFNVSH